MFYLDEAADFKLSKDWLHHCNLNIRITDKSININIKIFDIKHGSIEAVIVLSEVGFSLCHGVWCCVNTGNQFRIIFGSGTRLKIEASKSWWISWALVNVTVKRTFGWDPQRLISLVWSLSLSTGFCLNWIRLKLQFTSVKHHELKLLWCWIFTVHKRWSKVWLFPNWTWT